MCGLQGDAAHLSDVADGAVRAGSIEVDAAVRGRHRQRLDRAGSLQQGDCLGGRGALLRCLPTHLQRTRYALPAETL